MTNLTPAQLEEFESTFRYFDKDETNTLNLSEMIAALASLGIVYSEEDLDTIYDQLTGEYGAVTFEAFINLLVSFFFCPFAELIFFFIINIMKCTRRWISQRIKLLRLTNCGRRSVESLRIRYAEFFFL
jgi:hypothetical protein